MAASWRHFSTHSLQTQPWTTAYVGTRLHLIKGVFREDGYEVACWDTGVMWVEEIGREDMMERMKQLNPNVEAPASLIVAKLSTFLHAPHTKYTEATPTAGGGARKILLIDGTLSGLPFVWQFQFTEATGCMVQTHLIDPLTASLMELTRQKEELMGIIKRKDREIQDYKDSGASVSRRHLETVSFDENAFNTAMTSSQEFEGSVRNSTEIFASIEFQSLYRRVGLVREWLERELFEGSDESSCGPVISQDNTAGSLAPFITTSTSSCSPTTADMSPAKEEELGRRKALERKLEEERFRGKKKKKRLM